MLWNLHFLTSLERLRLYLLFIHLVTCWPSDQDYLYREQLYAETKLWTWGRDCNFVDSLESCLIEGALRLVRQRCLVDIRGINGV